jgi:fumarylpyruvate hydrolase
MPDDTNAPRPALAVPLPPPVLLPVGDGAVSFPVNRIFCVGRNYAAHAREMGHDPDREPPFFFAKHATYLVRPEDGMAYPPMTADLHHEIELVACIGEGGHDIQVESALDHVFGYAVGLDMTRRDLQGEAKKLGRPWDFGKGFDGAAVIGAVAPAVAIGHPRHGAITLSVNGTPRQAGDLAQQIWSVPEIVATLSRYVTLRPGDLIMTGTPEGVGPVVAGDVLEGSIDGVGAIGVTIGPAGRG